MSGSRRIHASVAVMVILALASCETGGEATPTASASQPAAGSIEVISDAPVIAAADLGDGNYGASLSAAYFGADGLRHAYVIGFGDVGTDPGVFHATSSDGLAWEIDVALPFEDLGLELSQPGPIPGSVIRADDGTWVMYLWGVPAPQSEGAVIYRATAPGPGGPWVADPEPILTPGDPGTWDDAGIDFPAVVPMGSGWLMLYGANDGNDTTRIGVATSDDGIAWVKDPEPVLEADSCGKPGAEYAATPRLMAADGGYLLLFDQDRETMMATSVDGHEWTCSGPEPLLVAEDLPGGQGIHTFAATDIDGTVSVLIESLVERVGEIGSDIWLGELQLPE